MNPPPYRLEERTFDFAKRVRLFVGKVPRNIQNIEDTKQLVRSSGSVGANYIEANESLGKKDFGMRIKISRKEAKESMYWLGLIDCGPTLELKEEGKFLLNEAREPMLIFGSILQKTK